MALGADEFLTVAARDNMPRDTLAPPDPYEEVVTVLLRIKGSDLAAYRAGQIDVTRSEERVQDPGVLSRGRRYMVGTLEAESLELPHRVGVIT